MYMLMLVRYFFSHVGVVYKIKIGQDRFWDFFKLDDEIANLFCHHILLQDLKRN